MCGTQTQYRLGIRTQACLYLEMLRNVSFDWKEIIDYMGFLNLQEYNLYNLKSSKISWSLIPQYPACQTIDITKYFDLKNNTPLHLHFAFKKATNLSVTLLIEDKRKALSKRSLVSNVMDYDGARIKMDLMKSMTQNYYLKISQTVDIEADEGKACKNYPTQDFTSYRECDEQFVYDQMKNTFNLMPFWAANRAEEITKLK